MPFTIKIDVNSREIMQISCRNCGPAHGDQERPTHRYQYLAEYAVTGRRIEGEVDHERKLGIETLSAIVFCDLSIKYISFEGGVNPSKNEEKDVPTLRICDLPIPEQDQFRNWLSGQTRPWLPGEPMSEQDGYYPWDYELWRKGLPVID